MGIQARAAVRIVFTLALPPLAARQETPATRPSGFFAAVFNTLREFAPEMKRTPIRK